MLDVRRSLLLLTALTACTRTAPQDETQSPRGSVVYECRDPSVLPAAGAPYRFAIDGQEATPRVDSLDGRSTTTAAGDVVRVGSYRVVLDGPGHYRFSTDGAAGHLMLSVDGDSPRLVALTVTRAAHLAELTDQERQGLRGIVLKTADPALSAELARLPLDRLVITYDHAGAERTGPDAPYVPPGLPAELRYLELDLGGFGPQSLADPTNGLPALTALPELRYLVLDESSGGVNRDAIDATWLTMLTELEFLRIDPLGRSLSHPEALAQLTRLRTLEIAGVDGMDDLAFAPSLTGLRRLDIRRTAITTLAPLSRHPALEQILAQSTPITQLPAPAPRKLRELSLLGTSLSPEAVTAFSERAPTVHVTHRWNQTLADTIACADRIRVRSGGLCHRERDREQTLFEITDAAEIEAALPLLRVIEDDPLGHCMCCGEPTLEMYRGDTLVAALGFHHGKSLRWSGWPSDAELAAGDARALCGWMKEHGAASACE